MKKSAIILCMLIFVTACISFFFLPAQIPAHFTITGVVDRHGSRMEIFIIPFTSLALSAILLLFKKIDPKKENIQQFKKAFYTILFIVNLLMFMILLLMIFVSCYPNALNIGLLLWIGICTLFIVLGNIMPKFKSNYFMGLRSPWTLANEHVWFKTHRFAGKVWFYGGILMLFGMFLPSDYLPYALLVCAVLLGGIPYVYSYLCFKEIKNSQEGKEREKI